MLKLKLKNSSLIKNTTVLVLGTALAQFIALGFQLVTRRLYSPADFGAYAVYFSLVSILVSLVSLQYNKAIVLPKYDRLSTNLLGGSTIIIGIFSFLILLSIIIARPFWTRIIEFPENYSKWLYFLPVTVFLLASYEGINYWLIRVKAFKASAINKVVRRTGEGATQSGIGFLKHPFGILAGDLVGNLLNFLSGIYQASKHGFKFKDIKISQIRLMLYRYRDFPKFYAIPTLFNTISLSLPILIINKLYTETIVGYFDLSRIVLAVPLAIITTSLSQVLLQRISDKKNNRKPIQSDIINLAGILSLLVLAGILFIEIFAENIFQIFGSQYIISGVYTKILIFSYGIKFIVSPLSVVFVGLERIKIGALWQIMYFCLLMCLFLFEGLEIIDFLKILVGIDLFCYTVYFIFIYFVVNQYDKSILR